MKMKSVFVLNSNVELEFILISPSTQTYRFPGDGVLALLFTVLPFEFPKQPD